MEDLEMTYYLDLKDRTSRQRIETAKPGVPVKVLVRLAADRHAPSIEAEGKLSADSQDFEVTVRTAFGQVTHSKGWSEVKEDIASHEKHD